MHALFKTGMVLFHKLQYTFNARIWNTLKYDKLSENYFRNCVKQVI